MTADIEIMSGNKANGQFKLCCKFENRDLNHFHLTCFDIVLSMDVRNIDKNKNCK